MADAIFQNQASGTTLQNLPPDTIFCHHASDVYHDWHSVHVVHHHDVKDVQGGIPKSDLLGVTVTLIHVAGQQFLTLQL